MRKANQDNRSKQLNDNNDAYWQSRGGESRPRKVVEHCETDIPREQERGQLARPQSK